MNVLADAESPTNIQRISSLQSTPVSEELAKLTAMLREICPPDAIIGFEFDGSLRLNIQLRRFEDVTRMTTLLPSLFGGIFYEVKHGQVARNSFLHRVSALVAR